MTQQNALQKVQPNNLAQIQPTGIAPVTLDRDNLTFFANMIEHAGLIPVEKEPNGQAMSPHKSKARVMAKIIGGTYYGFDPISAQENLHIINGRITLSAKGLGQLLHRSGDYTTRQVYLDATGCKLAVLKRNDENKYVLVGHVEFTKAMAEKAGLTKNPNYAKFAEDMFFARCITRVVKRFAPEVLDGQAVNYDLAKKEPEPAPTPTPENTPENTPELPAAAETNVGDVYEDPTFTEAETLSSGLNDDEIEGEFVPVEEPENDIKTLQIAATNLLEEAKKKDAAKAKSIMKGREIEMMNADDLRVLIGDLDVM